MLYYKYSDYLKNKYGEKVYKLPVNLPVTCPNRLDGDGCAFCAGAGTGFEAMATTVSVTEQLTRTRQMITRKYHANKYIAYFQNYTNTFLPPDRFRSYLMEATRIPGVVEISVSTRPDCVSAEYLDIMRDIRAMTGIQMNVELGLQTANYHTLQMIDRGHGLAEFIDAVLRIKRYTGISICTHVILNLPGDTAADAKETARILTALGVDIVKLHSLYIARNTRLCDWYENGKITVCSKEEYFERVITFLEQIPETVAVERMFSRIPEKDAVFCNWGCSWWRLRDELLQGHGLAEFIDAVLRIKRYTGISICTHVILNLPGDTAADAKETARILTALGVDIVKLHSLYIARNTRLCDWYENGKITVCSKEEYFERVITFLEQIPETVAVERMFSRIPEKDAVFCNWGCSWWRLRDELLQKMEEEGRYQGRCCDYLNGAALCLLKSE